MDSKKTLICRHCKGNHLTIQCPKKKKKTIVLNTNKSNNIKKNYKNIQPKLLVKISPLPKDLTKKELSELLNEWGPIGNIFLKHDRSSGMLAATVEFKNKNQGLKAIYQLDNTDFNYMIINVVELNNN